MKKIFLSLVLSVLSVGVFAQEAFSIPDYQSIQKVTNDEGSLFYYPALMKRYMANDPTLSQREYRHLYYGYIFQPQYSVFTVRDSTEAIQAVLDKEKPTREDWLTLIRLEKKHLEKAPFDMRDIHLVFIGYMEIGDSVTANIYHEKIQKIALTIMNTGDGKSEETALHVISVAHEYDIIRLLGLTFAQSQELTSNQCDYLKLHKNQFDLDGMFFDVKQVFLAFARSDDAK